LPCLILHGGSIVPSQLSFVIPASDAFLFLEFVLTLAATCTGSGVTGSTTTAVAAIVGNILMIELPSKEAGMGRL